MLICLIMDPYIAIGARMGLIFHAVVYRDSFSIYSKILNTNIITINNHLSGKIALFFEQYIFTFSMVHSKQFYFSDP